MSNDVIIEAWNTVLFEKFSRFKYLFIEGYASMGPQSRSTAAVIITLLAHLDYTHAK